MTWSRLFCSNFQVSQNSAASSKGTWTSLWRACAGAANSVALWEGPCVRRGSGEPSTRIGGLLCGMEGRTVVVLLGGL